MNHRRHTMDNRRLMIFRTILYYMAFGLLFLIYSCNTEPQPIEYGKDQCALCKMTIMDKKFGAELINKKGKALKFDSGECMVNYMKADREFEVEKFLTTNYSNPGQMIDATAAFYLYGGNVKSPMGGNLASFDSRESAEKFQKELEGELILWDKVTQLSF